MQQLLITLRSHVGTLLLTMFLALGVAYYVLAYLPQREAYLRARYFRVMHRVGENMREKARTNYKRNETMMREIRYRAAKMTGPATLTESDKYLLAANELRAEWKQQGLNFPHFHQLEVLPIGTTEPAPPAIRWDSTTQRLFITCDFVDPKLRALRITSWMEMDDFAGRLLRPDVFGHFLILGTSRKLTKSAQPFKEVFYSSFPAPAALQESDKNPPRWWRDTTTIQATRQVDLTLDGQPYKVFMQPLRLTGQATWLLGGAVTAERFSTEQRQLPSGWLELALIVILGGMLSLPFLKVLLMSPRESLDANDVLGCTLSLVVGLAALTVVVLSPIVKHNVEVPLLQNQLSQLATTVDTMLSQELCGIDQSLQNVSRALGKKTAGQPVSNPVVTDRAYQPAFIGLQPAALRLFGRPWQADDRMLWLDSAGNVVAKVANDASQFLPNLRERDYFQQITKHHGWPLALPNKQCPNSPDTAKMVLASVRTFGRVGNKFPVVAEATIPADSLQGLEPTRQPVLRSYATALFSLTMPVLPPGYSFCLIDERGEVQFHSNSQLSLSENLLDDCEPMGLLGAAILARQPLSGEMQYQGCSYRFHLRPLSAGPLFVVTLADQRALQARQMQTLSVASLLLLALAVGGLLLGGLILLCQPRRHTLLYYQQKFTRLWPRAEREQQYWKMLLMQVVILLGTLLVAVHFITPLTELCLLTVLPVYGFGFVFHALRLARDDRTHFVRNMQRVTVGTLVLVNITACYWLGGPTFLWKFLPCQLVPALAVGLQWTASRWKASAAWQGGLALGKGIQREQHKKAEHATSQGSNAVAAKMPLARSRQRFQHAFVLWVLSWVVLLGIAPALSCYFIAYRAEREIQLRFAHLQLLKSLEDNAGRLLSSARQRPSSAKDLASFNARFARAYYKVFFQTVDAESPAKGKDQQKEENMVSMAELNFRRLVVAIHPAFSSMAQAAQFVLPVGDDVPTHEFINAWRVQAASGQPGIALQMSTFYPGPGYRARELRSTVPTWYWSEPEPAAGKPPVPYQHSAFWRVAAYGKWLLVLLLVLAGLYVLLLALTRRIFSLNMLPLKSLVRHAAYSNASCIREEAFKHQFLLCPTRVSTYRLMADEKEIIHLDCRELDGKTSSEPLPDAWQKKLATSRQLDTVALERFEYQLHNVGITLQKIAALNYFMRSGKRVLVISRTPPEAFGDCGHARELCTEREKHAKIWQVGDALADALASFLVLYRPGRRRVPLYHAHPWEVREPTVPNPHGTPATNAIQQQRRADLRADVLGDKQKFEEELSSPQAVGSSASMLFNHYVALRWFLKVECDALPFLKRLEPELVSLLHDGYRHGHWMSEDEIVLSIQQRAQFQFRQLWEMLTPPEHYLLYDLAQDGLVNSGDAILIDNLLQKGLLVYDTKLRLVNESFRNYMLTGLTRMQAVRIEQEAEQEARKTGAWAHRSMPLFVLLSAAALFIFFTQRSALSETQAFLTAITGFAPLLARFVSLSSFTNWGRTTAS